MTRAAQVVSTAPPNGRIDPAQLAHMTDTVRRFRPAFPPVEAKLRPPATRPGTIDRARLVRPLIATPGPPIVSIIAPPGYGKTTLLAQWTARERRPVAWLTLDDLDNDPAILLSYLAVAFDRIEPIGNSIRPRIAAPRHRILATGVPCLAAELHRWERPAVLVLDDVHRLVDRGCLDALTALLDHLPPGFRVAIAGRNEPGLPLARLRAQRDLLEIGPSLLALDEGEADALIEATGLTLSPDEVRALTVQTEGWAVAIYLSALARGKGDAPPGELATTSGHNRFITAYLRSEFERGLVDEDVTVLTRTAVVETINPAIAQAVSGLDGAGERLRSLARGNLLIQQLGAPGEVYRYHHLLRDFLVMELERREPGVVPDLHRRAASWYAAAGDSNLAIEHATAAGDMDTAARLVMAAALPTFYGGRGATLDRWVQGFETEVFERHPSLAVIAGWIYLLYGRADATDRMADIAERSVYAGPPGIGGASFESERAMLRAIMGRRGPSDVLANAQLAAAREGPDSIWRANALWLLGSAHLLLGDAEAADARFAEAAKTWMQASATVMVAQAMQASISIQRGDWQAAEEHVRRSRAELAAGHFDEILAALIVYAVGARLAIHRGDLARVREDLLRAQIVRPLATHVAPWFSVHALLELARAHLAASDPSGARTVLREAEQIVRRRPALGTLTTDLVEIRRRLASATSSLAGASTLTAAELRLLPFLTTYLSFEEIGDRLFVSRHTVKTQALSIYGKLQASSRGEAVERAIEIGLLEPFTDLRISRRTTG